MECKFCKTENVDESVFCKKCGKRLDGKKVCPACRKLVDDDAVFCNHCGKRLDGKTICTACGNAYEGSFCPKCGHQERTAKTRATAQNGEITVPNSGVWKNILGTIGTSFALFGVVVSLIFVFLIGFGASVSGSVDSTEIGNLGINASESTMLYTYFGKVYENIRLALDELNSMAGQGTFYSFVPSAMIITAVIGTVVSAGVLVAVTVLSILSIIKLSRKLVGKEVKNAEQFAVTTYVIYALGASLLLALNYVSARINSSSSANASANMNALIGVGFSEATIAGLTLGAIGIGVYVACKIACMGTQLKDARTLVNVILTVAAIALVAVIAGLISQSVYSLQYFAKEQYYSESVNLTLSTGAWLQIWAQSLGQSDEAWDTEFFLIIIVLAAQIALVAVSIVAILMKLKALVKGGKSSQLGVSIPLAVISVVLLVISVVAAKEPAALLAQSDQSLKLTFTSAIVAVVFAMLNLGVSIAKTVLLKTNAKPQVQITEPTATVTE